MGTIQKVLEQDIGVHDVFMGVEHCPRGDELQENFNKLGRKGSKVAADEHGKTSEGHETTLHPSGGVLVAAANQQVSVVDTNGRKVEGFEGNVGGVAEMRLKCQEVFHIFCRLILTL